MDQQAFWLTFRLAFTTTVFLIVVCLPVAWWIAKGSGPSRAAVQTLTSLPLVLPPTVIGYYLLVGLGPRTLPGRLIAHALGHPLAFSFAGLLFGSLVYSLPFAMLPLVNGFRTLDRRYLEAAEGLGVPALVTFRRIVLPLSARHIASAAILTFTHTIGEFGVVLMLGGNIPGISRTLSIVLFDQVQDFNYAAANKTAAILLLLAAACLLAIYLGRSKGDAPLV